MANKQQLEESLITRVSKKIGKDNQSLEEVIEKIMKSVDNWAQEHKKELAVLDEEIRQEIRKPSFLLSKLIKIKYAEENLTKIVYNNLKRAPGNLSEEQRMLALYDTFAKFDYKCPYSDTLILGGKQSIHLEHIIPVKMGGPTDDWNCIPICGTCNESKGSKHLLDWWKDNRQDEEEFKLVKIFEHMTSKLLDETNTIKYVKQENNPMHLDAITFLNQLLNHIEENKQYIFNKEFDNEKEKQNAINSKLKELKLTFEKVVKKNDRNTKTDKQYFAEQKAMVKYIKSLGVSSYYKVAYTYFNTIKEMQNLGKPEEEIKEFCIAQDDWFTPFYEKLIKYKQSHNGSFAGITMDFELANHVTIVRGAKKGRINRAKLTEEMIAKLDAIGFPWQSERLDWFDAFYEKLVEYRDSEIIEDGNIKKQKGSFSSVIQDKEIGKIVYHVRHSYKYKDLEEKPKNVRRLTKEMIEKLDTIGFPWVVEKKDWFAPFYEKLIEYRDREIIENGKIRKHKNTFESLTTNKELCKIVSRIREAYKGNGGTKLTKEMIAKLDTIGFPWQSERLDWFDAFYEKLVEYRDSEIIKNDKIIKPKGSFNGLTKNEELKHKVSGIRKAHKGIGKLKLTKEMIEKLDLIGFPWEAQHRKGQEHEL